MIKNKENQNTAQNTGKPGTSNYVPWRQTEIKCDHKQYCHKGPKPYNWAKTQSGIYLKLSGLCTYDMNHDQNDHYRKSMEIQFLMKYV